VRGRSLLTVLLVLFLFGSGLLGLAWLRTGEALTPPAVPRTGSAPLARPPAPELIAPPAQGPPQVVERPSGVHRLLCLSAVDRSPLAGVSLYQETEAVAGPSAQDGVLEVPGSAPSPQLWIWAPGWGPARLPGSGPLPAEVVLEPATAGIQLRVTSTDPAARITRTRLIPLGTPLQEGQPWAPRLSTDGALSARGSLLPAGSYHLYVWVVGAQRAPRALPRQEIELEPGRTLTVELTADAQREGDQDG